MKNRIFIPIRCYLCERRPSRKDFGEMVHRLKHPPQLFRIRFKCQQSVIRLMLCLRIFSACRNLHIRILWFALNLTETHDGRCLTHNEQHTEGFMHLSSIPFVKPDFDVITKNPSFPQTPPTPWCLEHRSHLTAKSLSSITDSTDSTEVFSPKLTGSTISFVSISQPAVTESIQDGPYRDRNGIQITWCRELLCTSPRSHCLFLKSHCIVNYLVQAHLFCHFCRKVSYRFWNHVIIDGVWVRSETLGFFP